MHCTVGGPLRAQPTVTAATFMAVAQPPLDIAVCTFFQSLRVFFSRDGGDDRCSVSDGKGVCSPASWFGTYAASGCANSVESTSRAPSQKSGSSSGLVAGPTSTSWTWEWQPEQQHCSGIGCASDLTALVKAAKPDMTPLASKNTRKEKIGH